MNDLKSREESEKCLGFDAVIVMVTELFPINKILKRMLRNLASEDLLIS